MEIWKNIEGFEKYQISNQGNVKRTYKKGKIKYIKPQISGSGYYHITISKNCIKKTILLHILLGKYFIDNPENKRTINHKDGNKLNNNLQNLEWATYSENMQHAYNIGIKKNDGLKMKGKFGKNHNSAKQVNQFTLDGKFIKSWGSIIDIQRQLGIINQSITKCCKGQIKKAGGYIWKYKNI